MALHAYRHVIANERMCYWLRHRLRRPHGVECPRCSSRRQRRMMEHRRPEYRCKHCGYHFSLLTRIDLHGSRPPPTRWALAAALVAVGISSRQMARQLQVGQRIAWSMLAKFCKALQDHQVLHKLRGSVEVDETHIGGRVKVRQGRGAAHKTIVIGFRTRTGRIRTMVMPQINTHDMPRILTHHIARGSRLSTDQFFIYDPVRRRGFRHRRLKHTERFVRGQMHTQGIEGYWGRLKPMLMARHRSVSPNHL